MPPARSDFQGGWPPSPDQVVSAQDGGRGELSRIIVMGIPKLVAFYRGMGMTRPDAEDLASDTCESLVKSLSRLRDPLKFEPWFWRIARSKFYDHLRRKGRIEHAIEREEMYDDPADSLVLAEEHRAVRRAFLTLKMKDRELLWMRDVLTLGYEDMSGRLQMSEGAIRVAVMRARQRLEEALESMEERARD